MTNSPNKKPVFKLFGFSISESPTSFACKIKLMMNSDDAPYVFDYKTMGGASFQVIPYLADCLEWDGADYVLLEISACTRFSQTEEGYVKYLNKIANICLTKGALPCFIQLYRNGETYPEDLLTQTIEKFAKKYGFPCISLIDAIIPLREQGELDKYLWDGTHTTGNGAEFYKGFITAFMQNIVDSGQMAADIKVRPPVDAIKEHFLPIENFLQDKEQELIGFGRGLIQLKYMTLPENSSFHVELKEGHSFAGILYIMGPKTGWMRFRFNAVEEEQDRLTYDNTSYYMRYSYWLKLELASNGFTISQLPLVPKITLSKGTAWEGPREGYLVGVFSNTTNS